MNLHRRFATLLLILALGGCAPVGDRAGTGAGRALSAS
jgi:hypothetical protein